MNLKELLNYEKIAIQTHDEPDADALASGFALHSFLAGQGLEPRLFSMAAIGPSASLT